MPAELYATVCIYRIRLQPPKLVIRREQANYSQAVTVLKVWWFSLDKRSTVNCHKPADETDVANATRQQTNAVFSYPSFFVLFYLSDKAYQKGCIYHPPAHGTVCRNLPAFGSRLAVKRLDLHPII